MINVKLFDPNMKLEEDLMPYKKVRGKAIYKVNLEGSLYVLRIVSNTESLQIDLEELLKEKTVLERARGIENITNLVNF
jgi:hypothetical protein